MGSRVNTKHCWFNNEISECDIKTFQVKAETGKTSDSQQPRLEKPSFYELDKIYRRRMQWDKNKL